MRELRESRNTKIAGVGLALCACQLSASQDAVTGSRKIAQIPVRNESSHGIVVSIVGHAGRYRLSPASVHTFSYEKSQPDTMSVTSAHSAWGFSVWPLVYTFSISQKIQEFNKRISGQAAVNNPLYFLLGDGGDYVLRVSIAHRQWVCTADFFYDEQPGPSCPPGSTLAAENFAHEIAEAGYVPTPGVDLHSFLRATDAASKELRYRLARYILKLANSCSAQEAEQHCQELAEPHRTGRIGDSRSITETIFEASYAVILGQLDQSRSPQV